MLNEAARSAFPAEALLAEEPDQDALETLRAMPIPLLYGGFVKIEIEDEPGVWIRTFGNRHLNLPDLAFKAEGAPSRGRNLRHVRQHAGLFARIGLGVRRRTQPCKSGTTFTCACVIASKRNGTWKATGEMLVAEKIAAAEVNRE